MIPIVVGALGTIPLRSKENLRTITDFWGQQGSLGKCWRCRPGKSVKLRTPLGFPETTGCWENEIVTSCQVGG